MSWLVESGKATGLWGFTMFFNAVLNRRFGMDATALTLFGRMGDCVAAIALAARGACARSLRQQAQIIPVPTLYLRISLRPSLFSCAGGQTNALAAQPKAVVLLALMSGALSTIAMTANNTAIELGGPPSAVSAITAAYPAVTMALSLLFRWASKCEKALCCNVPSM